MTGIRLTLVCNRLINSISIGFRLSKDQLELFVLGSADLRMTGGLDKVDTSVNTVVDQLFPVQTVFLLQICIKTSLNIVDDGFPAISIEQSA
jgi:hypothetical protein